MEKWERISGKKGENVWKKGRKSQGKKMEKILWKKGRGSHGKKGENPMGKREKITLKKGRKPHGKKGKKKKKEENIWKKGRGSHGKKGENPREKGRESLQKMEIMSGKRGRGSLGKIKGSESQTQLGCVGITPGSEELEFESWNPSPGILEETPQSSQSKGKASEERREHAHDQGEIQNLLSSIPSVYYPTFQNKDSP